MMNLTPIGAGVQLVRDALGFEVNPIESNDLLEFGDYGVDTPFAAAGHSLDYLAPGNDQMADRISGRVSSRDHYSVNNGRMNRAASNRATAAARRATSKMLGPIGAMAELISDLRECQCKGQ
jgi:hypothetical protein